MRPSYDNQLSNLAEKVAIRLRRDLIIAPMVVLWDDFPCTLRQPGIERAICCRYLYKNMTFLERDKYVFYLE